MFSQKQDFDLGPKQKDPDHQGGRSPKPSQRGLHLNFRVGYCQEPWRQEARRGQGQGSVLQERDRQSPASGHERNQHQSGGIRIRLREE